MRSQPGARHWTLEPDRANGEHRHRWRHLRTALQPSPESWAVESPIAYLIAAAGIGIIAACIAEVASHFQHAGGPYCGTSRRKRRSALRRHERFRPTGANQVWSLDFVADQLAPAGFHSATSRLPSASNGTHAARSSGRCHADSSPQGGGAARRQSLLANTSWSIVLSRYDSSSSCKRRMRGRSG